MYWFLRSFELSNLSAQGLTFYYNIFYLFNMFLIILLLTRSKRGLYYKIIISVLAFFIISPPYLVIIFIFDHMTKNLFYHNRYFESEDLVFKSGRLKEEYEKEKMDDGFKSRYGNGRQYKYDKKTKFI